MSESLRAERCRNGYYVKVMKRFHVKSKAALDRFLKEHGFKVEEIFKDKKRKIFFLRAGKDESR